MLYCDVLLYVVLCCNMLCGSVLTHNQLAAEVERSRAEAAEARRLAEAEKAKAPVIQKVEVQVPVADLEREKAMTRQQAEMAAVRPSFALHMRDAMRCALY